MASLTLGISAYRIKRLLSDTGWSQAELGRKIGVSQQAVQLWVTGKVSPKPENLDKLSEVTGLPPYWFMLPPDEGDQVVTPDAMKLGPMQLDLLKTFNAFPEEDQQQMLYEMKERKETMDKTVARWLAAQKGNKA
ncbi:TPA: helix-turn-helix domain-containing protein [Raoultella ornithinolytica]